MSDSRPTISRKEIAELLSVSVDTIIRHEKAWHLNECLCHACDRPKLFFAEEAKAQLVSAGVIKETDYLWGG